MARLKKEDIDYFREELLKTRDELLMTTKQHGAIPNSRVDEENRDLADQAAAEMERKILSTIAENEDHLLQKVEFALRRLEEGTYNRCAKCGATIPLARLRAKPSVSLCVDCQKAKEEERIS